MILFKVEVVPDSLAVCEEEIVRRWAHKHLFNKNTELYIIVYTVIQLYFPLPSLQSSIFLLESTVSSFTVNTIRLTSFLHYSFHFSFSSSALVLQAQSKGTHASLRQRPEAKETKGGVFVCRIRDFDRALFQFPSTELCVFCHHSWCALVCSRRTVRLMWTMMTTVRKMRTKRQKMRILMKIMTVWKVHLLNLDDQTDRCTLRSLRRAIMIFNSWVELYVELLPVFCTAQKHLTGSINVLIVLYWGNISVSTVKWYILLLHI